MDVACTRSGHPALTWRGHGHGHEKTVKRGVDMETEFLENCGADMDTV